jgi:hypothetical protein
VSDQSSAGYPEEAPSGADPSGAPDETPQRDSAEAPRRHDDQADDADDGTATGNPNSAG